MKWVFSLALVASLAFNAWLALKLLDAGVTETYLEDSVQINRTTLLQCVAVTNEFLQSGARKDALIEKAKSKVGDASAFSNDGHLWVGQFGMKFDERGQLVSVAEWLTVHAQINQELE